MKNILLFISIFLLTVALLTEASESPKWSFIAIALGIWVHSLPD